MKHLLLRNAFTLKAFLLVSMIVGAVSGAWAQTYKLEKVTSVAQNGLYVFEQDGYVMKGSVSSSALQTTNSYKTSDLSGTENYVWELVYGSTSGSYYQILNVDTKKYITNSSSTNITLGDGSHWAFNFQEDGTVLIQNKDNSDRFLGYTNATSHAYKAYATSNLSSSTYPHAINVYQLVAEGGAADESVATSVTIDATGITNTDVYTGTDAGIFTASVVSADRGGVAAFFAPCAAPRTGNANRRSLLLRHDGQHLAAVVHAAVRAHVVRLLHAAALRARLDRRQYRLLQLRHALALAHFRLLVLR